MASFVYTPAKAELLRADHDFETGDFRIILCMTNTTADTLQDAEFVADVALDEYDGAAYARKTLAGEAVTQDDANNRGEFDANDIQWVALGAGTRQAQGMVLFRFVTNDADSPLIAWIDSGGFPFSGNGGNVDVAWNVEGILQAT
jgi:hypothetical protein